MANIVMQGELNTFGFFNLVQLHAHAQVTGLLRVYQYGLTFTMYFERGYMVAANSPGQEPLGEQLIRKGRLKRPDLERYLELQRKLRGKGHDIPLGQILMRMGVVDQKGIEECIFDQLIEAICLILELPSPYFSFAAMDQLQRGLLKAFIDLHTALLEAVRIADEIRRDEGREGPLSKSVRHDLRQLSPLLS